MDSAEAIKYDYICLLGWKITGFALYSTLEASDTEESTYQVEWWASCYTLAVHSADTSFLPSLCKARLAGPHKG